MFPRTLKEIEDYIGTNTTRNVAGLIFHLEMELVKSKQKRLATIKANAGLKRENERLQKFVDEGMVIALSFPGLQEKLYALLADTEESKFIPTPEPEAVPPDTLGEVDDG